MALFCVSLTGSVPSPDDVLAIRFRERLCVAVRRQAPAEGSVLHSFLDGKNPEWRTQDDQLDRAVSMLYQRLVFVAEARNDLSMYRHRIVNLEVPTYQGLCLSTGTFTTNPFLIASCWQVAGRHRP